MKLIVMNNAINDRGGAERVILKIAQKYRAKIYTQIYDKNAAFPEFGKLDIEIVSQPGRFSFLPKKAMNAINYGIGFYNMEIKDDYDVINPHMSPSEWIRNKNERVLWYCHTPPRIVYDKNVAAIKKRSLKNRIAYMPLSAVYKNIEGKIVPKIEGIAANSVNTQRNIERFLDVRSTVINPGVDVKDFSNKGDGKYFFYPSRIAEEKRQHFAVMAFNRFLELRKRKDYKLVIAGSLSKRYNEFTDYYKKISEMGGKNVLFETNPEDSRLKELYSRCTAVLYPPINEDFGIVPLEAMASGKPIIAVNEGGPKETIIDGKTGFLVATVEEMAARMVKVVKDEDAAEEMGREGRKRVGELYTWNNFFEKFDQLARKVADSHSSKS